MNFVTVRGDKVVRACVTVEDDRGFIVHVTSCQGVVVTEKGTG